MTAILPEPNAYTAAPMRNQLQVRLHAPVDRVWQLVGDHARLPEYSTGIQAADVSADGRTRTCRFAATDQTPPVDLTERIRWQVPGIGYSTSAEEPNPFLLTDDLSVVTVRPDGPATVFEWSQFYNSGDIVAAIASFDEGLKDIAAQLVARFGGQVLRQWAEPASAA